MDQSFRVGVGGLKISERAKSYVNQVLDANRLSYGEFSRKFERAFADLHEVRHAVFCNSGTSALHMAMACLKETRGWEDGDEVIVPSLTFVATVNMVLENRLKPVFVDIDPRSYNIDVSKIEAQITPRTRAILPVHLFGQPAAIEDVCALAEKHGFSVIEDSAETVCARYRGRPVGSWGDISCFSTYVAHLVITGVGGLALTDDDALAIGLRSFMNHGRDSVYLSIDEYATSEIHRTDLMAGRFSFTRFGHSFRATEFEAALGLAQLEEIDGLLARRKKHALHLLEGLRPFEDSLQLPSWPDDSEHVFMMFPLVLRKGWPLRKQDLTGHLERNGVETRDMVPLLNQPIYRKTFGDLEPAFPVAQWINASGFYVGCHPYLDDGDVDHVIDVFRQFFDKNSRS